MARVSGQLYLGDPTFKRKNNALRDILIEYRIFDLWILLKAKRLLNILSKSLRPMLRATCLMTLGAAILFFYAFNDGKLGTLKYEENFKSSVDIIPRLADHSPKCASVLEKELLDLKRKTHNIDIALRKMDTQLKNLEMRQKVKDVELADFAAEAVGGFIIATPDTESFYEPKDSQITLFGIPIWKPNYFTPRKVIQPWTQAGECWAFRGSHGKIEIELAYAATISHITMEHIPVSLSVTGVIDSAPKDFSVSGKYRNKYIFIDRFTYSIDGLPSQTFPVNREELQHVPFKRILLEVLSNWGNPEYTCIYRVKVHGMMYSHLDTHVTKIKKIEKTENSVSYPTL